MNILWKEIVNHIYFLVHSLVMFANVAELPEELNAIFHFGNSTFWVSKKQLKWLRHASGLNINTLSNCSANSFLLVKMQLPNESCVI